MAMAVPYGASCYICLDEGPDEAGKKLARDSSCRGDTAGFAHLSLVIEYVEQRSKQADDSDLAAFVAPWAKFSNCDQPFQNQMSLDLHVSNCE
jgi:hypothetical protein